MRRRLAAVALAVLVALAAPSRAMYTFHLFDLQYDVDARIAAFTGTLTSPQQVDKAHLTSISKTLHRKSKSFTTDLATAVKAATLVEKFYAADVRMANELTTALDEFQTPLEQAHFALAGFFGAPTSTDPYSKGRKPLAHAASALTSAASATSAVGRAKGLYAAAKLMLAAENSLPKGKFKLTPMNVDFGQGEPGAGTVPRTITVTNTGFSIILVHAEFFEYDTQGFFFIDLPGDQFLELLLMPGAHADVQIGFSREPSAIDAATRHLAVVAGSYSLVNGSFVNRRPGTFSEKRVTLTAEPVKTD